MPLGKQPSARRPSATFLTFRQNVPRDGIRDGCEDPVEFSEWCFTIIGFAWDLINDIRADACEHAVGGEPAQRDLEWSGETGGEQVGR